MAFLCIKLHATEHRTLPRVTKDDLFTARSGRPDVEKPPPPNENTPEKSIQINKNDNICDKNRRWYINRSRQVAAMQWIIT